MDTPRIVHTAIKEQLKELSENFYAQVNSIIRCLYNSFKMNKESHSIGRLISWDNQIHCICRLSRCFSRPEVSGKPSVAAP